MCTFTITEYIVSNKMYTSANLYIYFKIFYWNVRENGLVFSQTCFDFLVLNLKRYTYQGYLSFTYVFGQIHLPHLRIHKYFMDDSSVNFHDKIFLHFLPIFFKKWRKTLSWKFTDESSIKYLWIRKWGRWIWPLSVHFSVLEDEATTSLYIITMS